MYKDCRLCGETIWNSKPISMEPYCTHIFCKKCVDSKIRDCGFCLICRTSIPKEFLDNMFNELYKPTQMMSQEKEWTKPNIQTNNLEDLDEICED